MAQTPTEDATQADLQESQDAIQRGQSLFEEYCKKLLLLSEESELEELMRCMRKPLPVSFRVCTLPSKKAETARALEEARGLLEGAQPRRVSGITVNAPVYHAWYVDDETVSFVQCDCLLLPKDQARGAEALVVHDDLDLYAWLCRQACVHM